MRRSCAQRGALAKESQSQKRSGVCGFGQFTKLKTESCWSKLLTTKMLNISQTLLILLISQKESSDLHITVTLASVLILRQLLGREEEKTPTVTYISISGTK